MLTASIFSKVSYLCIQLDESFDEWVFFSQIQYIIITAIITATCLLLLPHVKDITMKAIKTIKLWQTKYENLWREKKTKKTLLDNKFYKLQ